MFELWRSSGRSPLQELSISCNKTNYIAWLHFVAQKKQSARHPSSSESVCCSQLSYLAAVPCPFLSPHHSRLTSRSCCHRRPCAQALVSRARSLRTLTMISLRMSVPAVMLLLCASAALGKHCLVLGKRSIEVGADTRPPDINLTSRRSVCIHPLYHGPVRVCTTAGLPQSPLAFRLAAHLLLAPPAIAGQGIPSAADCTAKANAIGQQNILTRLSSCQGSPPSQACCTAVGGA